MNRYKVTKQLGDGTYGTVLKGQNRQTGEFVSLFVCLCLFFWNMFCCSFVYV